MKKVALGGTQCKCNQGKTFLLLSGSGKMINGKEVILKNTKIKGNFGVCTILTAQANGTPMSCVMSLGPFWDNTSKILEVDGNEVLKEDSTISCSIGGTIKLFGVRSKIEVVK